MISVGYGTNPNSFSPTLSLTLIVAALTQPTMLLLPNALVEVSTGTQKV